MRSERESTLRIGWGQTDITPDQPVLIRGYSFARVSEGIQDELTATALVLESGETMSVLISCDLIVIPDTLRDAVRTKVNERVREIEPTNIILNATHTHNGPELREETAPGVLVGIPLDELGVMDPSIYVDFASERIADAVTRAWEHRKSAGVSWGLSHAVIGQNRLASYRAPACVISDVPVEGKVPAASAPFSTGARGQTPGAYSAMYGNTNDPNFSHLEGYVDHSVDVLFTWDEASRITGVIVNFACPSQVGGRPSHISADFWHETRQELRRRLGADIYVLPQCSPAGDQNSTHLYRQAAEERMLELKGRTWRQEIAVRIATAVEELVPWMKQVIQWSPLLIHRVETIGLPRRLITDEEVNVASQEARRLEAEYEQMMQTIHDDPAGRSHPRWFVEPSRVYWQLNRARNVMARYEAQKEQTEYFIEVHGLRLGDVALATSPFEYYLDYGVQIQARSRAVQTFLVQLAGSGTYVPTERAVTGGAYGAVSASSVVGPQGGRQLSDRTVALINSLF